MLHGDSGCTFLWVNYWERTSSRISLDKKDKDQRLDDSLGDIIKKAFSDDKLEEMIEKAFRPYMKTDWLD